MTKHFDIVIVGAGHAGAQAAIMLRHLHFAGTIALIGDEPELPYERPPLSKDYFAGVKSFDRILIKPENFWSDHAITMLPNTLVTTIEPTAHQIGTAEGRLISYNKLIWATGGAPRLLPLPGATLAGVQGLRTRADADAMQAAATDAARIVIIGGGYIGLEAAAVLAKSGKHVTLLEALPRVLARVAGEALSRFFESEHRAHGVDLRLNVEITALEGDQHVSGVRLKTGELIPADLVIVGIGIIPAVAPLIAAGAAGGNGVAVDSLCRTSLPDIYAIGDCALHTNQFADGAAIRLESVQNASDMANTAAKSICGDDQPYHAVPWFWSNQYDLKLQTVGLSTGHDDIVIRGTPEQRSFSVIYLKDGQVIALDCVNAIKDYIQGKALVVNRIQANKELLADSNIPLKNLA